MAHHVEEIGETGQSWRRTSFLDRVYLGCPQRDFKPNETIIDQNKCSNREFLQGQLKNCCDKPHEKTVAWSYNMESHAKSALKDFVNWQTQKEQLYKVSTPCLDD